MSLFSTLARLKRSLTTRGAFGTLRAALHYVRTKIRSLRRPIHPFDLHHNVDTSGRIPGKNLHSGHPHDSSSTAYWGTAPSILNTILQDWQQTLATSPYSPDAYTFIDIGCGKGRALMIASDTPFKEIIGVELNPQLAEIAQKNLDTWQAIPHACNNITVISADALEAPVPVSPVLFFLYHPFKLPVARLFLDRLSALSTGRDAPIDLVYINPPDADLVLGVPDATLLWSKDIPLSPEDTAADIFGSRSELCCLYRLSAQK